MTNNSFYLDFNVTGADRKRLVQALAEFTGADAKYLGAPSFAYEIDTFTVDRNGVVSFAERPASEEIEGLLSTLADAGFVSIESNLGCEDEEDGEEPEPEVTTGLTITIPRDTLGEGAIDNLQRLVESKGNLLRKAIGTEQLPVEVTDELVSFPWFPGEPTADEVKAYTHLVSAMCEMARNQKRITAKEKDTDNEKYAFRCFLLRLGFIGEESKTDRKILLRNLTGSSAFKSGARKEAATEGDSAPVSAAGEEVGEQCE